MLAVDDPLVLSLIDSIQTGDQGRLAALLAGQPGLAASRFGDDMSSRTALHLATDWPGQRPRVAETIARLVAAGAPVDGRVAGPHRETALHWAASADDIEAVAALLDAGADIEAPGGVLTDGAPLDDAVVFAQWRAARLLVARGAKTALWHAAALGQIDVLHRHLADAGLNERDLTNACWHGCRAGQLAAVQLLVERGADLDWVGHDQRTPRQAGSASGEERLAAWLRAV